ncbi:hypothetical protein CHUAL_003338 [Chamberlinius hualienensis]
MMNSIKHTARIKNSISTQLSLLRLNIQTSCSNLKSKSDDTKKKTNKPNSSISAADIKNIKKFNWENVNLFGPLRMTASQRKKYLEENVNDHMSEAECSGLISGGELNRELSKHVKIRRTEVGFRENCDELPPIKFQVNNTFFEICNDKLVKPKLRTESDIIGKVTESFQKDLEFATEKLNDFEFNRLKSEPSGTLRSKDLPNYLKKFPLCVNSGNEMPGSFVDYCKEILKIDSDFKMSSVTSILQQTMPESKLFTVGRLLHKQIENRLLGQTALLEPMDERLKGYWKSVGHVFQHFSDVVLLEKKVQHPVLCYKGVLDCVAKYRDILVIVEWKTSQRPRLSLKDIYDNPLQVAAYAGALNYSENASQQINHGIVVIAYPKGNSAHVHYLDQNMMEHYWSLWLERFEKYLVQNHRSKSDR